MKFGPIGGYIVTIGEYGDTINEHRKNTGPTPSTGNMCIQE